MCLRKLVRVCSSFGGYALGIAVVGYLGYHAIRWILDKCYRTQKVDDVAHKSLASKREVYRKQIPISKKKVRKLKRGLSSGPRVKKVVAQKLQGEDLEKQKAISALKMQSLFRGNMARVRVKKWKRHFLSYPLFEGTKIFVNEPQRLAGVPRALSGISPVYIFKDRPLVIKATGFPKNKQRFAILRKARRKCEENNYDLLDVAQARVYKKVLMESQSPLQPDDKKRHIGFYLEHLNESTKSIAQLTGFLCQIEVLDITGNTTDGFSTLSSVPIARSDNIASYLVEGVMRQGLVDIEHYRLKEDREQKDALETCLNLVRFYPCHLDTIISSAKKFDRNIESKRDRLEQERIEVLDYFQKAYSGHLDFVKQKKIDFNNPTQFAPLSPLRKKEVEATVLALLEKEDGEDRFNRCLSPDSDATLERFQKVFPEILDATLKFIQTFLRINRHCIAEKAPVSSYPELLSIRTIKFGNDPFSRELHERIALKLDMLNIRMYKKTLFASLITKAIFKELVRGREIDFYSDNFYVKTESVLSGRKEPIVTQCIFC